MLFIDKLKMLNNWRNTLHLVIVNFKCNVKIIYKLIQNYMKK